MEAVATAKVILEDQVTEFENIVEDSMFVDPKHHRQLKRAEVLKNIREECGVEVSLPLVGNKVNLKGARNYINASINRINETIKDLEDVVTIDCKIEEKNHRFL